EEEDVWAEHERSREGDPLLLAAGELARVARLEPREVHLGEALLEAAGDRRGVELPEPEPVGDVRPHGHVGPERVVLEDHPDVALVGPEPVHAPLAEPDLAGVRSVEPRGQPQERRLATARGPARAAVGVREPARIAIVSGVTNAFLVATNLRSKPASFSSNAM